MDFSLGARFGPLGSVVGGSGKVLGDKDVDEAEWVVPDEVMNRSVILLQLLLHEPDPRQGAEVEDDDADKAGWSFSSSPSLLVDTLLLSGCDGGIPLLFTDDDDD